MPMRQHSPIAALSSRLLQSCFFAKGRNAMSTLQDADALPQWIGEGKAAGVVTIPSQAESGAARTRLLQF
jgi:hypothetical protein